MVVNISNNVSYHNFHFRNMNLMARKSNLRGTRQRSWLRHYAKSRKVAGSSLDELDFFFQFT
jgi:hypothetical protein